MKQEKWQELKSRFQATKAMQPGWPTLAVLVVDSAIAIYSFHLFQVAGVWHRLSSVALLALVLLHSYLLLHEATHSAVSKSRVINDFIGHFCGALILMPFLPRQRSHLLHHMWAGHPKGDPANRRIIQGFSVMTEEQAQKLERIWSSWLPMMTINDRKGMWKDPFRQVKNGSKSRRFITEIRSLYAYLSFYLVVLAIVAATASWKFLLFWYLPAYVVQLVLEELVNLPHHAETPLINENDKALPYWEQHRVTHSCKSLPIWSRFVLLNFNLHIAHHLYPWVPWHALQEVDQEVRAALPEVEQEQTQSELAWSLENRRRPLLEIMGHYFDKIPHRA